MTDTERKISRLQSILGREYGIAYLVGYIESLEKDLDRIRRAVDPDLGIHSIFEDFTHEH